MTKPPPFAGLRRVEIPAGVARRFEPLTQRQLRAYARGLRLNDRTLTRPAAITLAKQHEAERHTAWLHTYSGIGAQP